MKKGEKLELLIKDKFPFKSNRKFAEMAEVPPTTLHGIFTRGLETASIQNAKKIAKALEMSVEELYDVVVDDIPDIIMKDKDNKNLIMIEAKPHQDVRQPKNEMCEMYLETVGEKFFKEVNYYGPVSAGKPESIDGVIRAEKIKLPKLFMNKHQDRDDVFVMKVNGESMNRILPTDSLIVCLPISDISEIKDNDIVVFTNDNETSVKRYKITEDNIIFSPESTNNKFYDIVVNKDNASDVNVIAKVISYHVVLD